MKVQKGNSLKKFFRSFKYAFNGFKWMFPAQRNFYIQLVFMIIALTIALYLPLSKNELAVIIMMIAMVLSGEIFNTAIEKLTDLVEPNYNPKVEKIKDLTAAAVLVLAIASVFVGIVIFIPHIYNLFF